MKQFLPIILGGSLLLTLAGGCQAMMISILQFVFEDNLKMGMSHSGASGMVGKLDLAVKFKLWLMAHLPVLTSLRKEIYLAPALRCADVQRHHADDPGGHQGHPSLA